MHYHVKHISIDIHFVENIVAKCLISISHIDVKDQLADLLIKALHQTHFHFLRSDTAIDGGQHFLGGVWR